jgi:hypothetical protein
MGCCDSSEVSRLDIEAKSRCLSAGRVILDLVQKSIPSLILPVDPLPLVFLSEPSRLHDPPPFQDEGHVWCRVTQPVIVSNEQLGRNDAEHWADHLVREIWLVYYSFPNGVTPKRMALRSGIVTRYLYFTAFAEWKKEELPLVDKLGYFSMR